MKRVNVRLMIGVAVTLGGLVGMAAGLGPIGLAAVQMGTSLSLAAWEEGRS